jgi:hypothetical protein
MRLSGIDRKILICISLAAAVFGAAALADEPPLVGSSETVRDFMIQNICIDGSGAVLEGVSPIDGNRRCVTQRDLKPGERLPYHKHDHPAATGERGPLRGYQRHDSFPVETAQFGVVVEHSFDFGEGGRRQFGVFDAGQGDGGDITLLTSPAVSFAATEDGGAGFQLFVGQECRDRVGAAALTASWIIALPNPNRPLEGETVARLNDLNEGRQSSCPSRLNAAFTRWYTASVRYRTAEAQGSPVTLTTLISEHYGGEHPESADHVERFYFTRELGGTRWERWQSASGNRQFSAPTVTEAAKTFAATGRCSDAPVPEGGAPMVLIDCREWTRIVPPSDPAGDRPGFLIEALRSRPGAPVFFAAPEKGPVGPPR